MQPDPGGGPHREIYELAAMGGDWHSAARIRVIRPFMIRVPERAFVYRLSTYQ
jgi:hypothetical protein